MTPEQACAHVGKRLGRAALSAEPLSGGLLNHVYRVYLDDQSTVVLKHSPPYVASAPQIPLDPGRSRIEATALEDFERQLVRELAHLQELQVLVDFPVRRVSRVAGPFGALHGNERIHVFRRQHLDECPVRFEIVARFFRASEVSVQTDIEEFIDLVSP